MTTTVTTPRCPPADRAVVILSGAGLSAASGVPTFRGFGGLWEGRRPEELATPEAWAADPDKVRRFYAWRRDKVASVEPNPGHDALVQLAAAWGERVVLVTQNVDGLLQRAALRLGAAPANLDVIEMHGSLWRVRCEDDPRHPRQAVVLGGDHLVEGACAACGAALRPDIVWFGEVPVRMDEILGHLARCGTFLAVGTSGVVYPAASFVQVARRAGAWCVEVNPEPTDGAFQESVDEGSETALPRIVRAWLAGTG